MPATTEGGTDRTVVVCIFGVTLKPRASPEVRFLASHQLKPQDNIIGADRGVPIALADIDDYHYIIAVRREIAKTRGWLR